MSNPIQTLFIIVILISFSGCNSVSENRDNDASGCPKEDFQKVINHFSKNPQDSLKLETAHFLIKNIQHHQGYTFSYSKQVDSPNRLFLKADSLIKTCLDTNQVLHENHFKKLFEENPVKSYFSDQSISISARQLKDTDTIQAVFLIDHIKQQITQWHSTPLENRPSKEDFFNAILPYRAANEPLEQFDNFSSLSSRIFQIHPVPSNLKEVNIRLNNYLKGFTVFSNTIPNIPAAGFPGILNNWEKQCREQAIYTTNILRSTGIPAYTEFTPQWKDRIAGGKHFWCTIGDQAGRYYPFSPGYQVIEDSVTIETFKAASKVYRYTFNINKNTPFFTENKNEYIPPLFDTPYIEDVTPHYFDTKNIEVSISENITEAQFCYLATFNAPEWNPVAFARHNHQKVIFETVQTGCVYAVIYYPDNRNTPKVVSQPFYLHKNGNIHYITPDHNSKQDLRLFQKFHQKNEISHFVKKIKGARFQGANRKDFSDAETLYTISEYPKPYIHSIPVESNKKFRYLRMISDEPKKSLNVAHMEFHSQKPIPDITTKGTLPYLLTPINNDSINRLHRPTKLKGQLYPSITRWLSKPMIENRQKGFDANMETYSISAEISFDMGTPASVNKIRYAPRNANNWVVRNNQYVLLYYNSGWVPHDTISAKYNFVEFKNVPSNTIYWLKNISKGKEEQIFMYKNNRQYFINRDDLQEIFCP